MKISLDLSRQTITDRGLRHYIFRPQGAPEMLSTD